MQAAAPAEPEELPGSGIGRRVVGAAVVLMAALMIMIGVIEFEAALIAVGGVLGAGGSLTFLWGWQALQGRRKAVMKGMERRVLLLAQQRNGSLTVSEVAADLNLSLAAAEKILIGMDDGFRVRSEITDEGILLYEFPELRRQQRLKPPGTSDAGRVLDNPKEPEPKTSGAG